MMEEEILEALDTEEALARYDREEKRKSRAITSFVFLGIAILVAAFSTALTLYYVEILEEVDVEASLAALGYVAVLFLIGFCAFVGALLTFLSNVVGFVLAMTSLSVKGKLRIAVIVSGVLHGLSLTVSICMLIPILIGLL